MVKILTLFNTLLRSGLPDKTAEILHIPFRGQIRPNACNCLLIDTSVVDGLVELANLGLDILSTIVLDNARYQKCQFV